MATIQDKATEFSKSPYAFAAARCTPQLQRIEFKFNSVIRTQAPSVEIAILVFGSSFPSKIGQTKIEVRTATCIDAALQSTCHVCQYVYRSPALSKGCLVNEAIVIRDAPTLGFVVETQLKPQASLTPGQEFSHGLNSTFVAFIQPVDITATFGYAVQDSGSTTNCVPLMVKDCQSSASLGEALASYLLIAEGQTGMPKLFPLKP